MMTGTKQISNSEDYIDVRDVIARVEELESIDGIETDIEGPDQSDEQVELIHLRDLLDELRGNGGDEEWRGAWYPIGLVRESHFEDYARELAEELDLIKSDTRWPYTCIDWEQAAEELAQDYSNVDFNGVEYLYRG